MQGKASLFLFNLYANFEETTGVVSGGSTKEQTPMKEDASSKLSCQQWLDRLGDGRQDPPECWECM